MSATEDFEACGKCKNRDRCEERGCVDKAANAPATPPSKERQDFEAWALDRHWSIQRNTRGVYFDGATREGWYAWEARAASAAPAPSEPPAGNFACYMIDHCEKETVTEENIQRWLSAMLRTPQYAAAPSQPTVQGVDISPALGGEGSLDRRHMSVPGKDI